MTNTANANPERFEEEWAKLDLAPMNLRGKADLQEAALIVMNVKPELTISGKLLTRTALAPFSCEEVKIKHGEEEKSAGRLVIPKFPDGTRIEEQDPSSSGRNQKRDDKEREDRRSQELMQQDPDQAGKDDEKASTGGMSSLDFNFLEDFEVETGTLEGTAESAEDETSSLEPPSAFMDLSRNLPASSSPGKFETIEKKLLMESPRRRRKESLARVPFLGKLPEEE